MEYLTDTVTIIRYFSGAGKIGAQALKIMDEADEGQHVILVSALTLAEILYLSEKNRIGIGLEESLEIISHADNYQILEVERSWQTIINPLILTPNTYSAISRMN